ncbi:hypothetical protein VNI00_002117 [Paramarasmius palmivorus]|uniref:F-box domain-containing protein n=1 Tax=Paramarasmius palmivorus TaxID=297713 RepID=A0AAW0E2P2_9AGAR
MLLCQKCNTPFQLDDTPQSRHPRVEIQILRSNVLPSPSERSQIQRLIKAEKSDLNQLEQTIKHVQGILKELKNRRDALCKEIQRRRSWRAPIRKFPVEVLKEIFAHVCFGDDGNQYSLDISSEVDSDGGCCDCPSDCWHCQQCEGDSDTPFHKITNAPTLSLSHVCCHWRNVVVASPSLWSSLRLDVTKMEERHGDLVDLYLQHSAQYPLKVSLAQHSSMTSYYKSIEGIIEDEYTGQVGYNVACSVVKELYHCKEFYYGFDTDVLIGVIPEPFRPQGLPLLTTFSDRVHGTPHGDRWFWDLVKVAPNLVDVSVERFWPERFPKNLCNLTIEGQRDYTTFLEKLPYFPKLVSLNLRDFSPRDTLPPPPPTPHSIHTRNLTITTTQNLASLDILFSSVSLPSLFSLKIFAGRDYSSRNDSGALCALIQRSGCSLEELTLHAKTYSSALISLLELQPSLIGLDLDVRMADKREPLFLVELFARMSDPQSPLLPSVQRLVIHEGTTASDENFTEIAASALNMAELRERHGEFVPGLSLTFNKGYGGNSEGRCVPVDLEKRAKELAERGVKCCIVFPLEVRIGQ